jgi:hypothetical protein
LERSQKCVIDKIVVKIKTGEILAQILSYFNILIFCPPIVAFRFFDWLRLVFFIISMVEATVGTRLPFRLGRRPLRGQQNYHPVQ